MGVMVRPSAERGRTRLAWLDARHSFSFGDYRDKAHMGYRALRVINEDRVAPGGGFDPHPHKDMEIVTYMLSGALRHEDSTGQKGVLRAGDAQAMSAGSGVIHSERNASMTDEAHLLQIWIRPAVRSATPRYADLPSERKDGLRLLASGHGEPIALSIGQDARIYELRLDDGGAETLPLGDGRGAWVQVAEGSLLVNGVRLDAGDGAAVDDAESLEMSATERALALVFDLA